ncbi:hypothetical protein CBL_06359 [Carabus blaptoides fortunei]
MFNYEDVNKIVECLNMQGSLKTYPACIPFMEQQENPSTLEMKLNLCQSMDKKDNETQEWIVTSRRSGLETVHGRSLEAAVNTAMQKFYGLKYAGDSIAKHIAKVEDLSHQLNTMEKTMESLLTRLLLEEERINSRNKDESIETNALVARKFNKNKYERCWKDISGYKSGTCFNCVAKGRDTLKKDCWHKTEEDDSKSETKHALIATEGQITKYDWILDNGASDHMSWFEQDNFTYFDWPRKIKVGNKDFIEALCEGNIERKA